MKKISLITLLILICSLPGYSQFWIEFGWNEPQCHQCMTMAHNLQLSPKQAKEYQKIVHKYGQRIEREARREYRHWDKSARKIYDLRMDRDRKIQRLVSPYQFGMYIRYSQDRPGRIHDYRGWYEHPHYAGYRHSPDWRRLEDRYWTYHWNMKPTPVPPPKQPRYDNRPPAKNQKAPSQKGRESNRRNDQQRDRDNNSRGGRR